LSNGGFFEFLLRRYLFGGSFLRSLLCCQFDLAGPDLTFSAGAVNLHHQILSGLEQNVKKLIESLLRDLIQNLLANVSLDFWDFKATPSFTNRNASRRCRWIGSDVIVVSQIILEPYLG
jgi:hypothetical protein